VFSVKIFARKPPFLSIGTLAPKHHPILTYFPSFPLAYLFLIVDTFHSSVGVYSFALRGLVGGRSVVSLTANAILSQQHAEIN
jgi:hypothetical protein